MGIVPKVNPAPGTLWAAAAVPHPSRESGGFFQSVVFQGRRKFKTEPSRRPRLTLWSLWSLGCLWRNPPGQHPRIACLPAG